MAKFTDAKGREWEVFATPTERDLVKESCNFCFYDLVNKETAGDLLLKLESDDDLVRDLLWCCCHSDCTKEEFQSAIYGDVLNAALESFFLVLPTFYRSRQHKQVIANMLTLMQSAAKKNAEIADVIGDKSSGLIAELIDGIDVKQLVEKSMNSATNSQDSQESTSKRRTAKGRGGTASVS